MNKYIVTIKREKLVIPLTIKAESISDVASKVKNGKYQFDAIINVEPAEDYRKRNKEKASFGSTFSKAKSSKRYLLG
ncbi:hypothetical protein M3649_03590 [Ureibacillus chungkukjangi]|uniref:hypothetical protein n=1 Tax=Ureibacillus chungkukjangi TaxID=1202712 RepID=UPI002041A146|nr:hypothetical protein [Ureibacillus chungkukjangi]MCM3387213.1 hypothetical protein [Ureibacillus chungkukjangi]